MTAEYRRTYEISALAEWESKLPDLFKEEGPLFVDLKVEPGEATRKICRSYPAQSTGKNFAVRWPMADEQNYGISSSSEIYCGIGCLRNQSTRKSPRERIFCGVGFPGEKTRDSG